MHKLPFACAGIPAHLRLLPHVERVTSTCVFALDMLLAISQPFQYDDVK